MRNALNTVPRRADLLNALTFTPAQLRKWENRGGGRGPGGGEVMNGRPAPPAKALAARSVSACSSFMTSVHLAAASASRCAFSQGLTLGLHWSTFSAQLKHFLWNALVGVSMTVFRTAQVELKSGRV